MELHPDRIHDALVGIGFPSNLEDVKNPSETFVLNVITFFFENLHIDVKAIEQPMPVQMESIEFLNDNPDLISLINVYKALAGVCSQLFCKDFYLTDLLSPMPKKTRRIVKILSNFLLYTVNKVSIIEERLEEMKLELQRLEDIRNQVAKCKQLKNQKASENAEKMALRDKLLADVTRLKALGHRRKAQITEVEERLKAVQKEEIEKVQHHKHLTEEATRMHKITEELESKVVRSPESYRIRLQELIEQKNNKEEKLTVMLEALKSKKPAMERLESRLTFVRAQHAKIPELMEACKCLTQVKKNLENMQKDIGELKDAIEKESAMPGDEEARNAKQEIRLECDRKKQLNLVRNKLTDVKNKKKTLENQLADAKTEQKNICAERDEIRGKIRQTENNLENYVGDLQNLWDKEISSERKLKDFLLASLKPAR